MEKLAGKNNTEIKPELGLQMPLNASQMLCQLSNQSSGIRAEYTWNSQSDSKAGFLVSINSAYVMSYQSPSCCN